MTDDEKADNDKEYEELLALFLALLRRLRDGMSREEALEELAELRADLAINHLFRGLDLDVDEALQLLQSKNDNNLTQFDKDLRDRVIAGVINLIDFAVCEEYQVMTDVEDYLEDNDMDEEDIDFNDEEMMEELEGICHLYNGVYALVENSDIEYAAGMALGWIHYESNQYLTYMTQNDDRVRPWHYALQGFTERKEDFPDWMIPPIEWGCRCFLETASGEIYAKSNDLRKVKDKVPEKPPQIDETFSESLCTCGRIFGKSHSYFNVKESDADMLKTIVEKIRKKYNA